MPRALIAGAGIAGLATALGLAKAGYDVILFERVAELEEFGAGLQLSPNATRALGRLGALNEVAGYAMAPQAVSVLDGRTDAELSRLELADAERRWGAPYYVVHRADLQRALKGLCDAEPNVEIRLGQELVGYGADGSRVEAIVKRGLLSLKESGDVLIGADGLRSKVREKLGLGEADAPTFSNRVAFRVTLEGRALPAAVKAPIVRLRLGAHAHLVQYPLREANYLNLVAVIEAGWRGAPPHHPWDGEADRGVLGRAFADWSNAARTLIGVPKKWRAWPLYTRPPLPAYAVGRVALAGDAAHPMVPFLAQGAAQAIEDAAALGQVLAGATDVTAALATYSSQRLPRAGRVAAEAISQARVYHMTGAMAVARNLSMRALGGKRILKRYDWLYGA